MKGTSMNGNLLSRPRFALVSLPLLVLLLPLLLVSVGRADETQKRHELMEAKLRSSQNILAALAREDYESIASNARRLTQIGKQQWTDHDSSEYRTQLQVFWFASQQLERLGNAKNVNGAAVAYVQLTLSCVNCHQHLRGKPASEPSGSQD